MPEEIVNKRTLAEFGITVLAILLGLVAGKFFSQGLASVGVPIDSGNPRPVALPGAPKLSWRS